MAAYRSTYATTSCPSSGPVPLTQINRHAIKVFVKRLKTTLAAAVA
jgi:hypothetical protein